MSGVNYPELSYYRLSGEQIARERQRNEKKASGEHEAGEVSENAGEYVPKLSDALAFYQDLCRQFPGFCFQLSDMSGGPESEPGELVMDIMETAMNRVGEGFSEPDRVSIEIDIGVIHKMMKDPKYAKEIKGVIAQIGQDYALYQQNAQRSHKEYTAVHIYEQNNALCVSQVCSDKPFSMGIEELRAQGKGLFHLEDTWKAYWEAYFDRLENEMLEDFFHSAIDVPREKMFQKQAGVKDNEGLFAEKETGKRDFSGESETDGTEETAEA